MKMADIRYKSVLWPIHGALNNRDFSTGNLMDCVRLPLSHKPDQVWLEADGQLPLNVLVLEQMSWRTLVMAVYSLKEQLSSCAPIGCRLYKRSERERSSWKYKTLRVGCIQKRGAMKRRLGMRRCKLESWPPGEGLGFRHFRQKELKIFTLMVFVSTCELWSNFFISHNHRPFVICVSKIVTYDLGGFL